MDFLKKQYKNQQINKEDLLAQLKAAIAQEDLPRNISSREVSLPNGKKVQLIEDVDPKLIPQGKEEEITLPNGDKVIAIRADPNVLSRLVSLITQESNFLVSLVWKIYQFHQ